MSLLAKELILYFIFKDGWYRRDCVIDDECYDSPGEIDFTRVCFSEDCRCAEPLDYNDITKECRRYIRFGKYWSQGYKIFFMLNSSELEISNPHKY